MSSRDDKVTDVLAILAVMKNNYHAASNDHPSTTSLRIDAVKGIALSELNLKRFKDINSAEKTIHDACARRLQPDIRDIAVFDKLAGQWLLDNSMILRDVLLIHAKSDSQHSDINSFFNSGNTSNTENYWITTHWPPRTDDKPDDIATGVWLPDGREAAGSDVKPGDKVLIYQARSGRPEIRKRPDGSEFTIHCFEGKEGIIAICEAESEIFEYEGSEPSKYIDGTEIWWRWYAPLKLLSRSGFVPRERMNALLEYKNDYNLRGFGDLHSGLKKITADQFKSLVEIFKGEVESLPCKANPRYIGKGGGGGESFDHFMLKVYVATHPAVVVKENTVKTYGVEYSYPTGDRADILLVDQFGKIIGVEIEVSVNDVQFDGPLQAIKYRYMAEVMTARKCGDSAAILVAYSISNRMKSLCDQYNVQCIEVDKTIVEQWSSTENGKKALVEQQKRDETIDGWFLTGGSKEAGR
jgi:hypothetical protein